MATIDIYNYECNALVLRVIDGDTLSVLTDFGVCKIKQLIRINRIDAPESRGSNREAGVKVKEYLTKLISGTTIRIKGLKRDMYGRVIAECTLGPLNISDHMLNNNLCKPCNGTRSAWMVQEYISTIESCRRMSEALDAV